MRSVMAACVLLSVTSLAVAQAPVKLDVEASWHVMQAGAQVPVRIRMLDSANRPVKPDPTATATRPGAWSASSAIAAALTMG